MTGIRAAAPNFCRRLRISCPRLARLSGKPQAQRAVGKADPVPLDQLRIIQSPTREVGERFRGLLSSAPGNTRSPDRAAPGRRQSTWIGTGNRRVPRLRRSLEARPRASKLPTACRNDTPLVFHHPVDRTAADLAAKAVPQVLPRRHDERGLAVLVERTANPEDPCRRL